MGWFWADNLSLNAPVAPYPVPKPGATSPPTCPMHKSDTISAPFPPRLGSPSETSSSCPVKSPNHPLRNPPPSSEPLSERHQRQPQPSALSKLNPLNYMPYLSNTRPADSPQIISLPLSRETSSIPRGDADYNWEYPSPQQMYNAMLRKGYTDTPTDAVESMVAVHNFLNEGAWDEIVAWESIFSSGLAKGWEQCRKGEQNLAIDRAREAYMKVRREELGIAPPKDQRDSQPKLLRFMGRPDAPTPKARILSVLGKVFPERFGQEPPFDRHDWYVARRQLDGSVKQVRYVIDYYAGGVQATGEPVFYLDIRPALDTPTAAVERVMRWGGDVWYRASGAVAREERNRK